MLIINKIFKQFSKEPAIHVGMLQYLLCSVFVIYLELDLSTNNKWFQGLWVVSPEVQNFTIGCSEENKKSILKNQEWNYKYRCHESPFWYTDLNLDKWKPRSEHWGSKSNKKYAAIEKISRIRNGKYAWSEIYTFEMEI